MKLFTAFRSLALLAAVSISGGVLLVAQTQTPPTQPARVPVPPAGGTYNGPGDTVPPPCTGPGCPTPPGPGGPPHICAGPCTSNFRSPFGCFGPCYGSPSPLPGVNNINWTDIHGQPVAPPCMQGPGVYRVFQVTIQNLRDAVTAAHGGPDWPRSNLCFFDTCPEGIDALFVYETLPFQFHPEGIPTASGGYLQACGMTYDVKISRNNGTCQDLGAPTSELVNSTFEPLECDTSIVQIDLQFDGACLETLVNYYYLMGLYNWWNDPNAWLTPSSVAFVVAIKCCPPNGIPTCGH